MSSPVQMILDGLSWVLLGSGSLVLLLSAVAILRMPTFYTRLHAASVNETLGPGLILAGLLLQTGGRWDVAAKLVLILVFLVLTGPLAGHAIGKAAFHAGLKPGEYMRRLRALQELDEEESL